MVQQVIAAVLLLLLLSGCGSTKELPPAFLLTANMHDKCMEVLREGLNSDEFWPSVYAAEALSDAGYGFDVTPVLTDRLEEEEEPLYRAGLARALVRNGRRENIVILQNIILGDDEYARIEAVKSLFFLADAANVEILYDVMRSDENGPAGIYAAGVLAVVEEENTLQIIRDGLLSENPLTRLAAADIIPILGSSEQDTTRLLEYLSRSSTDLERLHILRSLAVLDHGPSRKQLPEFLDHSDPTLRHKAAYAVAEAWLYEESGRLYERLEDPSLAVRVRAAQALFILTNPVSPFRYLRIRE